MTWWHRWRRPWLLCERDRQTNLVHPHGRYWTAWAAERGKRKLQRDRGYDRRYVIYAVRR